MEILLVSPTNNYESKVAHYTRASTAWKMIGEQPASAFRLNTIKNVNDPMEGRVLHQYLVKSCEGSNVFNITDENTLGHELAQVLISCFTFNHDSLNQFRLYGKENEREASGVSLVFQSDFFDSNYNVWSGFINNKSQAEISNKIQENANEENKPQTAALTKLPLFRCIYLDPDTGYLRLACRDAITFYREEYAGNPASDISELIGKAKDKWKIYQNNIAEKEEKINTEFNKIISNIKKLKKPSDAKTAKQLAETLNFILQPLQYLIKHAAFQEEQECRMIYITNLSDEKIKMDWGSKQVFVEYEPKIKDYVDKIYLSPGARMYEDFFRKELGSQAVRISTNPFRNK